MLMQHEFLKVPLFRPWRHSHSLIIMSQSLLDYLARVLALRSFLTSRLDINVVSKQSFFQPNLKPSEGRTLSAGAIRALGIGDIHVRYMTGFKTS